jgi:hypothetical protein
VEKRGLEHSLAESQREAFALAAQLERASEILEAAQKDAAAAQAAAAAARSRSALLEKAWASALEVGWLAAADADAAAALPVCLLRPVQLSITLQPPPLHTHTRAAEGVLLSFFWLPQEVKQLQDALELQLQPWDGTS